MLETFAAELARQEQHVYDGLVKGLPLSELEYDLRQFFTRHVAGVMLLTHRADTKQEPKTAHLFELIGRYGRGDVLHYLLDDVFTGLPPEKTRATSSAVMQNLLHAVEGYFQALHKNHPASLEILIAASGYYDLKNTRTPVFTTRGQHLLHLLARYQKGGDDQESWEKIHAILTKLGGPLLGLALISENPPPNMHIRARSPYVWTQAALDNPCFFEWMLGRASGDQLNGAVDCLFNDPFFTQASINKTNNILRDVVGLVPPPTLQQLSDVNKSRIIRLLLKHHDHALLKQLYDKNAGLFVISPETNEDGQTAANSVLKEYHIICSANGYSSRKFNPEMRSVIINAARRDGQLKCLADTYALGACGKLSTTQASVLWKAGIKPDKVTLPLAVKMAKKYPRAALKGATAALASKLRGGNRR